MTGILAGLRIVEGSAFIAAPLGGMALDSASAADQLFGPFSERGSGMF